jgi:hypothetical protein
MKTKFHPLNESKQSHTQVSFGEQTDTHGKQTGVAKKDGFSSW